LKGLNRLANGKITSFYREDGLGGNDVRVLFVDRQGTLWAGSSGGGLTRYQNGRFTSITTRDGLISDWVEQILEDDDGHLWLGSNAGLMRASLREINDCASGRARYVHCVAFRREEGLLLPNTGTGFQPSSLKTRTGHLWFATEAGVVVIDPKRIKPNPKSPPVYIERLLIDGETHDIYPKTLSSVTVSPHKQRLEFHYTGLDLSAPGAVRFKHKLEGYDRDWQNTGTRREVAYTGVPPGRYQFHVKAANNDGFWNEAGAVLGVTITPPWWQSWWFRVTAMAGFTGMVFGLYELRVVQHKKARAVQESFARRLIESQEQERKRLAHELHDSLGQSLQIIKGRTQLGSRQVSNPAQCAQQFEEIDDTVSRAIQEVRAISHALRPAELDQLGLTKAIEWMVENVSITSTARFASELENLDGLFSPEMEISLYRIIQEGLNNVVKHAAATEVILELKRESNTVRFSLLDNGRGFLKTDWKFNGSLGLESIAERAKFLGGTFDIQSAPGKGTRLTVILALQPRHA
jgi:signal transduction histidine kinase